jgi:cyclopropane fatty-acyl-phospholipid synthase-like methyltransferase
MPKSEFDKFAHEYDEVLGKAIPKGLGDKSHYAKYKLDLVAADLDGALPRRILDFGCGSGRSLKLLVQHFPNAEIYGYDLSTESLDVARNECPSACLVEDWNQLRSQRFDLIFAANVFHHIPPEQRSLALARCNEILADPGNMFIFEHNPFNPVTRWVFERCPFDVDAEMLSAKTVRKLATDSKFRVIKSRYTLFFPTSIELFRRVEAFLSYIPLGAQYYVQLGK